VLFVLGKVKPAKLWKPHIFRLRILWLGP